MAWPTIRRETALVSVDFMNLYLARMHMYQGPCEDVARMLRSCVKLGKRLADDPAVVVYLDVKTFEDIQPIATEQLFRVCYTLDLQIVDVLPSNGKDQVDPVIIDELLEANTMDEDIPFLLVSADKGFGLTLKEIRQKREVFVGLPVTGKISSLTNWGTDWDWVHSFGWIMAAFNDVVEGFSRTNTPPEYDIARKQVQYLLSQLHPGLCIKHWRKTCELKWSEDPKYWLTESRIRHFVNAFEHLGVLKKRGSWYKVTDHELFRVSP